MDFVPEVSALVQESYEVDPDTMEMLKQMDMGSLSGLTLQAPQNAAPQKSFHR